MANDQDLTKNPYYKATISSLADGEEVLWSGKPELKCYQKRMRFGALIFYVCLQALLLPVIIRTLFTLHRDVHAKGILGEFAVINLAMIATIWIVVFLRQKTVDVQYTITSNNVRYAFLRDGNVLTRRIGWKQIKSVKIRESDCNLLTITIKPYFLTGKDICTLDCLSQGYEVLAIVTTYRPDLHDDQWFS